MTSWTFLVGIALGLVLVVSGSLFRLGHLRYQAQGYFRASTPMLRRNAPFIQVPGGIGFLLGAAAIALPRPATTLTWLLGLSAFLLFVIGMAWLAAPPAWVKPAWIRAAEHLDQHDSPPVGEQRAWIAFVAIVALLTLVGFLSVRP